MSKFSVPDFDEIHDTRYQVLQSLKTHYDGQFLSDEIETQVLEADDFDSDGEPVGAQRMHTVVITPIMTIVGHDDERGEIFVDNTGNVSVNWLND